MSQNMRFLQIFLPQKMRLRIFLQILYTDFNGQEHYPKTLSQVVMDISPWRSPGA